MLAPAELARCLGDSVQVAMTTYAGVYNEKRSNEKLDSALEASYRKAVGGE